MAHYQAKGNLHLADTRDQAAENAVQAWARLTETHDMRQVALIADASNVEIDRLNARAQHLRDERGELGPRETYSTDTHYPIREHDHVAFIAQHKPHGQPRVENGTRGEVTNIGRDGTLTLTLDGSGREIVLAGKEIDSLRLAYAQHVYRQQGATVERSVVLTGGWQTSKESAYVQATRARNGTDWYLARDQLGQEGQDPDRITRLAERMSQSEEHTPSIAYREARDPAWDPTLDPLRTDELIPHMDWLNQTQEHETRNLEMDFGLQR
jgi:ATP-dependent exoDNAse (exonuclease V) alpha subunit